MTMIWIKLFIEFLIIVAAIKWLPFVIKRTRQHQADFQAFLLWEKQKDYDVRPNWFVTWTHLEFLMNFPHAGNFQGAGWYTLRDFVFLALPTQSHTEFLFLIWQGRDPRLAFRGALSLPITNLPEV